MMPTHASYELLGEMIRRRFKNPKDDLRELFGRLTFNILCGNTDDHARNHAAFWDGKNLRLTSAYDVCPQSRLGEEAGQAMRIVGNNNRSQLVLCRFSTSRITSIRLNLKVRRCASGSERRNSCEVFANQHSSLRITPKDFEKLAEDASLSETLMKRRVSKLAVVLFENLRGMIRATQT